MTDDDITVTIDPDEVADIRVVSTDDRGRAYLGTDLAGEDTLTLAVIDTTTEDDAADD
ncbi:hypothetical protein B4589_009750 [Halolamina sp. CBA1230]|uniref:hypothetical protein n=1 Tax=Halolamina sp. CBA1230 TaxID=1853690 RepID=UPI001301AB87|nr:hypothetical protein [Halolamina sp. CBA1230]QKY20648.1 hypothetical protein B4589_009750 [Halolamina sp. CBA1230]